MCPGELLVISDVGELFNPGFDKLLNVDRNTIFFGDEKVLKRTSRTIGVQDTDALEALMRSVGLLGADQAFASGTLYETKNNKDEAEEAEDFVPLSYNYPQLRNDVLQMCGGNSNAPSEVGKNLATLFNEFAVHQYLSTIPGIANHQALGRVDRLLLGSRSSQEGIHVGLEMENMGVSLRERLEEIQSGDNHVGNTLDLLEAMVHVGDLLDRFVYDVDGDGQVDIDSPKDSNEIVVHRDIDLKNLLVDDYGNIRLMDFGIARVGERQQGEPMTMGGTWSTLSPEQVLGGWNSKTDQYALGIVLSAILTGKCDSYNYPTNRLSGISRRSGKFTQLEINLIQQNIGDEETYKVELEEMIALNILANEEAKDMIEIKLIGQLIRKSGERKLSWRSASFRLPSSKRFVELVYTLAANAVSNTQTSQEIIDEVKGLTGELFKPEP